MSNRLQIYKLNSLPIAEEIEPNSIYLIPYGLEHLDMYVSNNDGLELKRIINTSDLVDYQTTENLVTELLVKSDTTYPSTKAVMDAIDVGADALGSAKAVETLLQPQIDNLSSNKLDAVDYVQHFRGLFSSYTALSEALPTALDGDYAHIDSGTGFDRMVVVWDSSDNAWVINEVGVASNTDEIAEGSSNLYFTGERVRQTPLTGMVEQTATPILSTDQLLAAIGKLQAQINNTSVTWVNAASIGLMHPSISPTNNFIELARINGMLWIRGSFKNTDSILYESQPYLLRIDDIQYKVVSRNQQGMLVTDIAARNGVNIRTLIDFKTAYTICVDAATASTCMQYFLITVNTLMATTSFYNIPPTCLGVLVIQ